jgi:hypothetical protein
MKNKLIIIFTLLVIINLSGFTYGKDENRFDQISKIKAGQSTKHEVERIFGLPVVVKVLKFSSNENVYYKTKEGSLEVSYTLGNCAEGADKYNLEKGTILSLFFHAREPLKISALKLDLKPFKTYQESDTQNWYHSNAERGITYVSFKNKIFEVELRLTKSQLEQYSCAGKS